MKKIRDQVRGEVIHNLTKQIDRSLPKNTAFMLFVVYQDDPENIRSGTNLTTDDALNFIGAVSQAAKHPDGFVVMPGGPHGNPAGGGA